MITGHNSDVDYAGRVYHVQTEDKGRDNPIIETLIYTQGEILDKRQSSYSDLAREGYSEKEVVRRMDEQHRRWVREVRNGRYDPEGPKPFGYNIITNRSFDDVVLDTLGSGILAGGLKLDLVEEVCFYEGVSVSFGVQAWVNGGEKPATGAKVLVRLVRKSGKPVTLFKGETAEDGTLRLTVEIPELDGAEGIILLQADAGGAVSEIRQPVLASTSAS
jgi:hypothetical protein